MAKYKLQENGVLDTETSANIPDSMGNRHWVEYLDWDAVDGNTADPMDVFVEDWDNTGRGVRDDKLTASDWTHIADSQLTTAKKTEWATYRQELRDLPASYPDYSTVIWPSEPAA